MLLVVFCALFLPACGATSLDLSENLVVAMLGVFEQPQDASGNTEPRSMNFTLESVKLITADGTEQELYEGDPEKFRIISRSQIISETGIGDYVDDSFTSLAVTFSSTVTAAGKTQDDLPVTLDSTTLTYEDLITVTKAKSLRLNVKVQWKNIVSLDQEADPVTETVSAPSFSLELKNQ